VCFWATDLTLLSLICKVEKVTPTPTTNNLAMCTEQECWPTPEGTLAVQANKVGEHLAGDCNSQLMWQMSSVVSTEVRAGTFYPSLCASNKAHTPSDRSCLSHKMSTTKLKEMLRSAQPIPKT
jgi:hypothetical protein